MLAHVTAFTDYNSLQKRYLQIHSMVINEIYYYHLIKIEIKNEVTKRPKYSFRKNNYEKQRSSSLDF